jgi:cysteate synthase
LRVDESAQGMYRYKCWLPVSGLITGAGGPVTFKSERLGSRIGIPNLWVAFNGYWPERGAMIETATFKELEAYAVLSRIPKNANQVLALSSAGNTAAAFAHTCSQNGIRCLIAIPKCGLAKLRFSNPLGACVKVVCLSDPADYTDAIAFIEHISRSDGFLREGGVRNVARRDGIGTTMLNAAETIGRLPDYYFQAIGSGSGAIAAHEASKRLVQDGRFGGKLPRLILSQNAPFTPIVDAWKVRHRELIEMDRDVAKARIQQMIAPVLSNQRPPYPVVGGVFDVLTESKGDMLSATNSEAKDAMQIFEECEGIDIDAAAGVALASLMQAARVGQIEKDAVVLLHVTGGGWSRRAKEKKLFAVMPDLEISYDDLFKNKTLSKIHDLVNGDRKTRTASAAETPLPPAAGF